KHLAAAAHKQNRLVARMTDAHSAIGDLIESDTLGEVWTSELLFFLRHRDLPLRSGIASLRYLRRQSIMLRNSCRVSALSRKQPSMRLVTRSVSGLCTPRVVMQWCVALIMTPTPCGSRTSLMVLAICAV